MFIASIAFWFKLQCCCLSPLFPTCLNTELSIHRHIIWGIQRYIPLYGHRFYQTISYDVKQYESFSAISPLLGWKNFLHRFASSTENLSLQSHVEACPVDCPSLEPAKHSYHPRWTPHGTWYICSVSLPADPDNACSSLCHCSYSLTFYSAYTHCRHTRVGQSIPRLPLLYCSQNEVSWFPNSYLYYKSMPLHHILLFFLCRGPGRGLSSLTALPWARCFVYLFSISGNWKSKSQCCCMARTSYLASSSQTYMHY